MSQPERQPLFYPYASPQLTGRIKQHPEDFKVSEQLGFTPSGSGEHLFILVRKTSLTTHQLIQFIADDVGISPRKIGYSGLKDKHAVTRQWLSLHLPGLKQKPVISDLENIQIMESHWHDKKLRVGSHKSNRFEIIIRQLNGQADNLDKTLNNIEQYGFANYFGEQRFGVQRDNVEQALKVLNNRHKLKRLSRHKKSLYISSLRSELFNKILSLRIQRGIWKQPVDGDAYTLAGSQSVFAESLNETIKRRYADFDIHCAISLYGIGESTLQRDSLELENEVFSAYPDITQTLQNLNIKRALRANRAIAKNLHINYKQNQAIIKIQVELEKGLYLTSLLDHFIK